ncbi:MAG: hypothetical protein GY835_07380 [bacterium]|nr:hypothetical protein [bacterium]
MSLLPAKGTDASDFRLLEAIKESESLIDITRVRDDDYHEKSFKLTKPGTVQILAIGEYSKSDRQFVDSGWITDLDSGRKVWEMTKRNTQHAGGDEKNRMFDGLVDLPEGSYQVCYSSDDSHAYRSWNTAAPFQPKSWGLTIIPGPDFDKGSFSLLTGDMAVQSPNCLVQIVRVRNREHQRDTFVLDTETEIHIYAIGEWDEIYDEFADYGWIEDSRGHTVWEMTRRNTRFAGGARKNRRFDDSLVLEAGEYEVHFRTDDSHAFNQWNAERPRDPRNWGITIRTADN